MTPTTEPITEPAGPSAEERAREWLEANAACNIVGSVYEVTPEDIADLIRAAEARGAREMREKAAQVVRESGWCDFAEEAAAAIRALGVGTGG